MVWYQDWATSRRTLQALAGAVKADGCSASPDLFFKECCDEHDVYYRTGRDADGKPITRADADRRLRRCQARFAKIRQPERIPVLGTWFWRTVIPWAYWTGVRIGGWRVWRRYRQAEPSTPA